MDVLPNGGIFKELQLVHDTGYFSSACSLEEHWQQVSNPCSTPAPHLLISTVFLVPASSLSSFKWTVTGKCVQCGAVSVQSSLAWLSLAHVRFTNYNVRILR